MSVVKEQVVGESEWTGVSARYLAPPGPGAGDAWGAEAAAQGRRGTQRIVRAGEVVAPDLVAGLLGVDRGSRVVERRRIMYLDDVPCELTDTYYPWAIAEGTGLGGTARIRGGAVRLLADLGHVGVRAEEQVVARMPSGSERTSLALDAGVPVLELARRTLNADGRPIQADVMVMSPRGQKLRYEIGIG